MNPNLASEFLRKDFNVMLCDECRNPPKAKGIDPSRILIRMDPVKEGIIELRPGVDDISLGDRKYAQVRIYLANSENYIKGMAFYSEDIPEKYDLIFYTRLTSEGKFAGYGQRKQTKEQKQFVIIENEDQMLAWSNFENSIRQQFERKCKK